MTPRFLESGHDQLLAIERKYYHFFENFDCNINLVFWTPQIIGSVLSAEYWFANENVPYERFYIRTGVVKSELRAEVKGMMSELIIPALICQMEKIIKESRNSTKLKQGQFFEANFENGTLIINGAEVHAHGEA